MGKLWYVKIKPHSSFTKEGCKDWHEILIFDAHRPFIPST